jgi:hypothetical protein
MILDDCYIDTHSSPGLLFSTYDHFTRLLTNEYHE